MESAITARLERVVQEVAEVRRRAQTLSDELEQLRAERGRLLTTLEEERAALAATRLAFEVERAQWQEQKALPPLQPSLRESDEPQVLEKPEAEHETLYTNASVPASVAADTSGARLPSPRKFLGKLKFVGLHKGKIEEQGLSIPTVTSDESLPQQESSATEPGAETIEFEPVALLEEEPSPPLEPAPVKPPVVQKPKRVSRAKKTPPPPRFAPREFLASLPSMDDDQLDLAAFGIAQLDDSGSIVALNHRGAILLHVDKNEALDQVLFSTLLPDSEAQTRFNEGTLAGKLDAVLLLESGVTAHLFRHSKSRTSWVLLRKQEGGEA